MGKTKQNGILHRLRKNIMCGVLSCVLVLGAVLTMPGMGMTAKADDDTFIVGGITYRRVGITNKCMVSLNFSYQGTEVNIPTSVINNGITYTVEYVNYNAFNGCKNINKITLGNTIKVILNQAFEETNIEEIEIPESVIAIGYCVFNGCSNLKKICFKGKQPPSIDLNWLGDVSNIIIELPDDADISEWKRKLNLDNYPNVKIKGDNEDSSSNPSTSGSSSTTSSSPNQEKSNNGEIEVIEEEPVNRIPEHVCQYEWEVVREVGADQEGLEQYLCKLCGNVQSTLTTPASQYQVQELYTKVTGAGEGENVTYDTGLVHTVCDKLFTKLQQRKDVTLVITYQYKGENYRTTFPAGEDYTELMQDTDQFYGMLGLNGRCGIVTEKN